jgi:hypothetical protein
VRLELDALGALDIWGALDVDELDALGVLDALGALDNWRTLLPLLFLLFVKSRARPSWSTCPADEAAATQRANKIRRNLVIISCLNEGRKIKNILKRTEALLLESLLLEKVGGL